MRPLEAGEGLVRRRLLLLLEELAAAALLLVAGNFVGDFAAGLVQLAVFIDGVLDTRGDFRAGREHIAVAGKLGPQLGGGSILLRAR